ncbi:transposase [Acidithiobacillus thiooxidans]|uniref:IS701 family transposase n=1 Tax=Acidithiobacillus thiooxidans TaxID=930 RepID=UPI0008264F43|nr:transposase [Acidithiobacillus thiooxidans]OCX88455.1 transposase [Acidithiobacillus thiooxidans]
MSMLRDLLLPFQSAFSDSRLGRERAHWFPFILLAIVVPFTSSMSSNLLRSLQTLFGLDVNPRRFYLFMASTQLAWDRLWPIAWNLIPSPLVDGRLILALDDTLNDKTGKRIFGCGFFFDHTAKVNHPTYPWAQNIVMLGLLKPIKGRWACLPLGCRFYHRQKDIAAGKINVRRHGRVPVFQSKMAQAAAMILPVATHFSGHSPLIVCDSWFGNNGLWKPLNAAEPSIHLLSRLRSSTVLYAEPADAARTAKGRPRKYGDRCGSVTELATSLRAQAQKYTAQLYGKAREIRAYDQIFLLKTLRCPVRVVWVFRKTQWVAFFTTDLTLSVTQIVEYYGARWKIEAGFKEIKQEIGSARTQTRTADAVTNHLHFCLLATTLTWIYADRITADPKRRHIVKGRTSFAFSDVRKLIADEALSDHFLGLWPHLCQPPHKSFTQMLMRMVA